MQRISVFQPQLVAVVACFAALFAVLGGLQAAGPDTGAAASAKARQVLETHCARCHQAGQITQPQTLLFDILNLDSLARDASLVRPGVPDASPLYTSMLRRAMPPPVNEPVPGHANPTDEDIQAVRDWITALPAAATPAATCSSKLPTDAVIVAALSGFEPARVADMRFITLPCASDDLMTARRDALQGLVQLMSRGDGSVRPEPVDLAETVYRISLSAMGWSAADWETLIAGYPERALPASQAFKAALALTGSAAPSVRGDWLAHAVLRRAPPATWQLVAGDVTRFAGFARAWERDLDLDAVSGDLGMGRTDLSALLGGAQYALDPRARQLLQGPLPRVEFVKLKAQIAGASDMPAGQTGDGTPTQPLSLALWSDNTIYDRGALLTLRAHATADCHLTLIGIDGSGRATVLFPNEIEPNNLLRAGAVLSAPGATAAYQFRLNDPGTETVVGICTIGAKIADNIHQDFERQRFTLLGDWRTFVAQAWKPQAAPAPRVERPRRRGRGRAVRRSRPVIPAKIERLTPENHARTAITFDVR